MPRGTINNKQSNKYLQQSISKNYFHLTFWYNLSSYVVKIEIINETLIKSMFVLTVQIQIFPFSRRSISFDLNQLDTNVRQPIIRELRGNFKCDIYINKRTQTYIATWLFLIVNSHFYLESLSFESQKMTTFKTQVFIFSIKGNMRLQRIRQK